MKSGILINAMGDTNWIGSLYYAKNMAFQLAQNYDITSEYNIILYTTEENEVHFSGMSDVVKVKTSFFKGGFLEKIERAVFCKVHRIKYMFPASRDFKRTLGIISIAWIPDFQHNHLPELFDDLGRKRTCEYMAIAQSDRPLVLSSYDCKKDLQTYYIKNPRKVYVVPFVSYIEPEIRQLTAQRESDYLKRLNLKNKKYIYIANQFWKHKNHIVVLKAIEIILERNPDSQLFFVFTGKMHDYRNPGYIEEIKELLSKSDMKNHILNLGFVERTEQIAVMKNAEFIIQPSFFEGWGTVVEDAKVLDKTIILSDISVHREQKNDKCILFNPYDPESLADIIEEEAQKKHYDDIEGGIKDMYTRARNYSEGFFQLLLEN